jgi:hypothetical protein
MADSQNALAPQAGILNQLYKAVVPVNARTFLDTVTGSTAPITEKNFAPEELDALRQMYIEKQAKNAAWKQQLANKLSISKQAYEQKPETKLVYDEGGTKAQAVPQTYDEYIRNLTNQIASFDRTKNKTSLSYNDYPDQMAAPTFDSWLGSVYKSYTDPAYRMKTILGSFNVMDTPEGQKAVDQYKFDASDYYKGNYGIDPASASVADMYKRANGPIDFLDMLMIKKFPKMIRPVDINLGKGNK